MSRSAEAVHAGILALLPPGRWRRDAEGQLARLLLPLAGEIARFEAAAEALLEEMDPRSAVALLPDWERLLGADPCGRDLMATSLQDRQASAHQRLTMRGTPTPAFFVALAAQLGVAVTIEEAWPFEAGDEAGAELVPEGEQFSWLVRLPATRVVDFEAGGSEAGDLLGEIMPSLVECVIRYHAPAHTTPVFQYAEA